MIALDRDAMRVNVSAYEPGSGFYEIWTQEPEPGPCPPSVREALGKASQALKQYNLASKRRHVLQEWYVERLKEAGFINCHTLKRRKANTNARLKKVEQAKAKMTESERLLFRMCCNTRPNGETVTELKKAKRDDLIDRALDR